MNETLNKINEMIHNTEERLSGYGKNERLDVKLRTLLIAREIIQAEQNITPCYVPSDCEYKENSNCSMGGPCCYQNKPQTELKVTDIKTEYGINRTIERVPVITKGDIIRKSNESLAEYMSCNPWMDYQYEHELLEYLNQPLESEENMDMLTDLTPKESARIRMLIEHQEKELDRRNRLIESLTTDRDYWELEAKKYCAEVGEIRILVGQELCNK